LETAFSPLSIVFPEKVHALVFVESEFYPCLR